MAQRNKNPYFGFTQDILRYVLTHDSKSNYIFDQMMSLSLLIRAGKGQIIKTKRFLNETRSHLAHLQFLKAYNLDIPVSNPDAFKKALLVAEKQALEEIRMHQKDLKKIYVKHNEMVNDLKKAINIYLSDNGCPAVKQVNQTQTKDVGDIKGLPKIKEEETLTTLNLTRIGVLTLIKKLSEEIKAKPNCDKFTITIKKGVTK